MAKEVKPLELSIKVYVDDEQAKEIFDAYDIKFTKKRFKEIMETIEEDPSVLEDALHDLIGELAQEYED